MNDKQMTTPPGRPSRVSDLIASMDGARLPGGCDCCNAYQTIRAHAFGSQNIHMITVHHDDWCPVLAAHQAAGASR